jgi:HipA N-terminal domain
MCAGRRIGTLRFDSQGARQSAAFEYDRQWLAVSEQFALEPDLPLVTGAQFHKPTSREASIFHGAIADTEPDGWTETAEDLAYLRGRGTSLGGLRPKCSVIDADGALSTPITPAHFQWT